MFGWYRYQKDQFREAYRVGRAGLQPGQFSPETHKFVEARSISGQPYSIGKSTMVLASAGGVIAAATLLDTNIGVRQAAVFTDELYDELSTGAQEFFIKHEEGHIDHGDLMKIARECPEIKHNKRFPLLPAPGTVEETRQLNMEFAADEYAADIVGWDAAIASLAEAKKMLMGRKWIRFNPREFNLRMDNLRRKMEAA